MEETIITQTPPAPQAAEQSDAIPTISEIQNPVSETQSAASAEEASLTQEVPESATGDGEAIPETAPTVDYARLAAEDLAEIQRIAPALAGLGHLSELPNAARYGALRDAGLSVEEAFWAASHGVAQRSGGYDNRSHLQTAVPRPASGNPAMMSASEMAQAKELFSDMSESDIQRLYARCRA